jgi:hypothetical protein
MMHQRIKKPTLDDRPPLDRWRADEVLEPNGGLWGMKAISRYLGVSVDTVRRWVNDDASGLPVSKPAGRWFAEKNELLAWLRNK